MTLTCEPTKAGGRRDALLRAAAVLHTVRRSPAEAGRRRDVQGRRSLSVWRRSSWLGD